MKPGPAGGGRKGRRGGQFWPVNPLALNHAVLLLMQEQREAKPPKASEVDEFSGITRQHLRRLRPHATMDESEMRPSLVTVLRWCNWRRWTIDDLKHYFEACGLLPCAPR